MLLQIGKEAIPPDIVPMILASRDRKELAKYALSAPPHGLCLVTVNYNEEHLGLPSGCPKTSFGRHHTISKCKLPFYWNPIALQQKKDTKIIHRMVHATFNSPLLAIHGRYCWIISFKQGASLRDRHSFPSLFYWRH